MPWKKQLELRNSIQISMHSPLGSFFFHFLNLSCLTHLCYPENKLWRITNHYCVVLCFHTSQNEMVCASVNKNYLFFIHFKTFKASLTNALIWKSIQWKNEIKPIIWKFYDFVGFCFFVLMLNSGKKLQFCVIKLGFKYIFFLLSYKGLIYFHR